jgi:lysozyme
MVLNKTGDCGVINMTPKNRGVVLGGLAAALALCIPLITQLEGTKHVSYRDVVGVLTVCTGHTGSDIVVKHVYSDNECKALLTEDVQGTVDGVLHATPDIKDKPYLLASAISFSYNVGVRTYQNSSVAHDFNDKHYAQGCLDMKKYIYAGGHVVGGLINRRAAEYAVCMRGV